MMGDNASTGGGLSDEAQAVIDKIEEKNADLLRLQFTDILGMVENASISVSQTGRAFTEGIYFDGLFIDGFVCTQESDMRLEPSPSTFAIFPWRKKENNVAGRLICDAFNTPTDESLSNDLRDVFKRVIERTEELGYDANVALEPEFFLSEGDEDGRATTVTNDVGGYFDLALEDLASDACHDATHGLESIGFDIEVSYHEVTKDQHEVNLTYDDAPSTADNVAVFRSVACAITAEHDLHATFMPKPIPRISGSGMYMHISLLRDGENAFHDGDDESDLSDTAKSLVVSIPDHAPVTTMTVDPTVSSYKRLAPGHEAPVYIVWSDRNYLALIRKPAVRAPAVSYTEVCFPSPSYNPHPVFTAFIRAGLDGVEKGLDCPDPIHKSIYEFNGIKHEGYGTETLSKDLGDAADTLEESEVIREALGDHAFKKFIEVGRSEFKDYLIGVSQWEFDRHLETF